MAHFKYQGMFSHKYKLVAETEVVSFLLSVFSPAVAQSVTKFLSTTISLRHSLAKY